MVGLINSAMNPPEVDEVDEYLKRLKEGPRLTNLSPHVERFNWNSPVFPDTSDDAKLAIGGVRWQRSKGGSLLPSSSARQ